MGRVLRQPVKIILMVKIRLMIGTLLTFKNIEFREATLGFEIGSISKFKS